nr:MAG TPA: Photosystem II 10 kDa phosphoprotein [Caudoviricetes sp.]
MERQTRVGFAFLFSFWSGGPVLPVAPGWGNC